MFHEIGQFIIAAADVLSGYPLFFLLIGGGLYLFISSGAVSLRRLPASVQELRKRNSTDSSAGQISSAQALTSVIGATVGMGNIAGVAIALVMGGPGAIFWMWISALVGMATKYHEGVLAIMYRGKDDMGNPQGGPMHIIEKGLGRKWKPLAVFFAIAGLFGTMCIMNANQLTEAFMSAFTNPDDIAASSFLGRIGAYLSLENYQVYRLLFGLSIAIIVGLVILGGIKRIANVASVLVPFMVGMYFLMVLYIILTNLHAVPGAIASIFREAFNLRAGIGALAGIAIIGARRAALVNDAGIGTASIMHGASANKKAVREGLIAMLGPSIDSGLVCTLTAIAILICGNLDVDGIQGLSIAMEAFSKGIPMGDLLLMLVVVCFALSSMFSYSFYGTSCATYLFGTRIGKYYRWFFLATLVIFAVVPIEAAVGACDLFYALMAIPTMTAILWLSPQVRRATKAYFEEKADPNTDEETEKNTDAPAGGKEESKK